MKAFTPLVRPRRTKSNPARNQEFLTGFTLIETLVVISVFTLILGAVFGFILNFYRNYGYILAQSAAITEAKRGVETMVKEIRGAKTGDDGSFPIALAGDKEFVFYSDIDKDGKTERVRYFLGTANSDSETKECETSIKGGSCGVDFFNFLKGTLTSAHVKVSVDGDFGMNQEYADIKADGNYFGELCKKAKVCTDCPGTWQGTQTFDVTNFASDNSISFLADATSDVDPLCPYAMKAKFEFSWAEELGNLAHEFKKGVIEPVIGPGGKISYPSDREEIIILSSYVRNTPPIFEYFGDNGDKIIDYPARLKDTKLMKIFLVVDMDPNRDPDPFELGSQVQLRNLYEL